MGGEGQTIQADETYYGNSSKRAKGYRKGHRHKASIVALIEKPSGRARAVQLNKANKETVRDILVRNASRKSELHTDESGLYTEVGKEFAAHKKIKHG